MLQVTQHIHINIVELYLVYHDTLMSHITPCKVYIITYDENLEKTHRIFHQLVKIGFTDIKIIVGINKKELRKVSTNT